MGETDGEKTFVKDFIDAIAEVDNSKWHLPTTAHILCIHLLLEEKDDRAVTILERAHEQVMIRSWPKAAL
jgi:hypothetical protein